ncbi:MAG: T9SS type A sorting domain-containing protein [Bacteroidales bacterium]
MKRIFALLFSLILILSCISVYAQKEAIKPEIKHPVYFDISPPLRDMPVLLPKSDNSWKVIKNFINFRKNRNKEAFPSDWTDPLIQHKTKMTTAQDSTILNFLGNTNTQGYDPPDTYGDVGPNDYFALVNCHFSIYDKTGTLLVGPTSSMTMWNGMPNNTNGGDGVVLYDEQANRWLFAQLSYPSGVTTPPYFEMIAVSQTPDPTGSWYRWEYTFTDFPDYPKLGVWPDGYYMSVNRFADTTLNYLGTGQAAFDRSAMIAGDSSAQMVYFTSPDSVYSFLPSDCDSTFPTAGTPNYFVFINDAPDFLGIYNFHVDWNNPSNSTFVNSAQLTVAAFNDNINNIPQKGTTVPAEALSDRLMYRLQFRKFSDHWSMVCNHTVNVGNNVAGIRWYELRNTAGSWNIYQQSTYSADTNCRWMGSIAMDTAGNLALGFSISSSNMYPSIKYTGRLFNDPLNVMDISEKGIFYGSGSNTSNDAGGYSRWGDYSSMSVDPSDGMTFWYTQQYLASMGTDWQTRIATFNFANVLNLVVTASPDTICAGDSVQLNANATGGSGSYSYSWTSDPPGFISNSKDPVVTPLLTTTYIADVNDGTNSRTDSVTVSVIPGPTANAGTNTSYPDTITMFPLSGIATNYSGVRWLTAGDGHFSNDTLLTCFYYPGSGDRNNLGVLLTLQAYPLTFCSDTATDTVFIRLAYPLGVESSEMVSFSVSIIPNPASGIFTLVAHGIGTRDLLVTITNINGEIIFIDKYRSQANDYSKIIDFTGFPKGIYMVQARTDIQSVTKKLVIK